MNQLFTSFSDFKRRYPIRPNDAGALLGSGSYGRVFKVEDQLETEWVAIKISEFKGNDTKSLKAEVELAQRVPRQTNIARYDACYRLETDTSVSDFAIMKYYPDGNLADLLHRNTLTPAQIYDITQGILLGLQHLHSNRIVHRDFKPANILISRDNAGRFIPKIADFGLSKLVSSDELENSDFDLSDGRGTPSYKAPEQIEGSRVSFNLDLWAFGVILYEILTGEKPFRVDHHNSSEQSVRREIERKIVTVSLPDRLNQVAEPYATMIRRCLVHDIHKRVRREDELLDLLDTIPQLLAEADAFVGQHRYEQALPLFEQILSKREHHAEAEKGRALCRATLGNQQVNQLLAKADDYVAKQQFDNAKNAYEQALQFDPTHLAAIRGLALCVNRLRPEPTTVSEPVAERTDLFEERTDVYSPPAKDTATSYQSTPDSQAVSPKPIPVPAPRPTRTVLADPLVGPRPTRSIPWHVLIPVAAGLAGLVYYNAGTNTQPTPGTARHSDQPQTAGVIESPGSTGGTDVSKPISAGPTKVPKPLPGAGTHTISQRIDIALDKARTAYARGDYAFAMEMCNSALLLDPARRDVVAFLNSSTLAHQRLTGADKTPVIIASADAGKPSDVLKSTAADDKEKELREKELKEKELKDKESKDKQEAQVAYDQLIDEGIKAISGGNNKAVAIVDFGKATSLANQHNLNTAKGDGAYTTYVAKANKIFNNEEYEGAKGWYKVAQALKDTPEVRARIKQCILQ